MLTCLGPGPTLGAMVVFGEEGVLAWAGLGEEKARLLTAEVRRAEGESAAVQLAVEVDGETYVVVVTRGHRHDLDCVRQLLGKGTGYLGMIGSRRRVAGVFELLRQEGVDEETLAELRSPIGLGIGAETVAEIALSILAEIVQVQRGGSGRSLRLVPAGGASCPRAAS